jgi:hypothetical protein
MQAVVSGVKPCRIPSVVPCGIITSIYGCPQREIRDLRYDFIGDVDDVFQSFAVGLSLDGSPILARPRSFPKSP